MKKFEIGQKVYSYKSRYRDLIVKEILDNEIVCSGEEYHINERSYPNGWSPCTKTFRNFELRDTPFKTDKNRHVKNKWGGIIQRNPNMVTRLSYLYEDVLKGEVVLDPPYQRGLVWTLEQKQKYIENLFLEKAKITPTMILNWRVTRDRKGAYEILDGRQRISTLFEFIENKFCLCDGTYFRDLSMSDTMFILNHDVNYTRIEKISCTDLTLEEKIELFLEINELGTKMSEEHIQKVKEMLNQ